MDVEATTDKEDKQVYSTGLYEVDTNGPTANEKDVKVDVHTHLCE